MSRSIFAAVGILVLTSASAAYAGGFHSGGWRGGSRGGVVHGGGLQGGVGAGAFSYGGATATSQSSAFASGGSFGGGYGRRGGYNYAQGRGGGRGENGPGYGYGVGRGSGDRHGYGHGYGAGSVGFALGYALADGYSYGYGSPYSYTGPENAFYGSSYGGEVVQPYVPQQGEVYGAYSAYDQAGYYGGEPPQAGPPDDYWSGGEETYPGMEPPPVYAPSGWSSAPAVGRCGC